MALPSNYKQVAMAMQSSSSPSRESLENHAYRHHRPYMMSPGPAGFHNILKERLRPSGSSGDRGKDNSSPFVHSSHGNPAFTPQKIGKGGAVVDPRAPKPPKAPEKPLMPFMRYSRKVWDQVKTANPELKLWEVSKIIAQMWKEAPDSERQEFIDEYEADKIQYVEALKVFHATPEYGAWNRYHVNRLKAGVDSEEPMSRSTKSAQERRLDIQPAEDEEDQDDGYTFKHVAHARFLRNHRLINEIFSDAIVPDVRSVVTTQRMQVLKRQVQSLTMHQMKLETELQQIEEKFEAKKRKFIDSSEQFQEELKKHCKPAVDEETFKKMVERQFETMRRDRQRQLEEPKQVVSQAVPKIEENAGAPSAPNTTVRQNEMDKPDTAEQVLQPMETESAPPAAVPDEKKPEPVPEGENSSNSVPESAPPSSEVQPASEENTSENMDIEPPAEPAAHPSHPINKPSDVPPHPAYVTPLPHPQAPAPPGPPPTGTAVPPAGPPEQPPPQHPVPPHHVGPAAAAVPPPHQQPPPTAPYGMPPTGQEHSALPPHPHPAPHHMPQGPPGPPMHHEGHMMGQPPYGAPGYGHPGAPPMAPQQQGPPPPGGVRPYYPPYQYHGQYGPPSHYMPMHAPPHGPPVHGEAPPPAGPPQPLPPNPPPRADEGEENGRKEGEPAKE